MASPRGRHQIHLTFRSRFFVFQRPLILASESSTTTWFVSIIETSLSLIEASDAQLYGFKGMPFPTLLWDGKSIYLKQAPANNPPLEESMFSSMAAVGGNFVALVPEATVYRQSLVLRYDFANQWYGEKTDSCRRMRSPGWS